MNRFSLFASLTLAAALAAGAAHAQYINFGDNSSQWANDGECDDPRFQNAPGGRGMATTLLREDEYRDANDCRALYNSGLIQMAGQGHNQLAGELCGHVQFGDDSSTWANDGECDDPRFQNAPGGAGMADTLLNEDSFRDASDCRMLCNRGIITLRTY